MSWIGFGFGFGFGFVFGFEFGFVFGFEFRERLPVDLRSMAAWARVGEV